MRHGNFWTVEFITGGQGNRYTTRKGALAYATACNSYSERHSGERVVRAVLQYREWMKTKTEAV